MEGTGKGGKGEGGYKWAWEEERQREEERDAMERTRLFRQAQLDGDAGAALNTKGSIAALSLPSTSPLPHGFVSCTFFVALRRVSGLCLRDMGVCGGWCSWVHGLPVQSMHAAGSSCLRS